MSAKRTIVTILLVVLLLAVAKLVFDVWENFEYSYYHSLAITACQNGDMANAYKYIDIAIQHARDPDLISEGGHDRRLFDHNVCSE